MELSGTGSDRTFTLYYKKPQLGSLSSPGTCTDLDPSGCYFIACKMDYDCSTDADCSPTGSGVCNPRNCAEGGAVAGVDTAQVTAIITEQLKKKNCSDDSGTTKVLKGFKETTGQLDIDCEPLPAQQQIQGCEAGEVLQGFKDNGDSICVPQCSAGRTVFEKIRFQWKPWYPIPPDINNPSESDKGTITYEVGTSSDYLNFLLSDNCSFLHTDSTEPCITVLEESRVCQCPSGKKWVQADSKCMTCTGSGFYWQPVSNGYQCRCSGGVKKKNSEDTGYICSRCNSDQRYVNGQCRNCPSPKKWVGNTCTSCPSPKKWVGSTCTSCPSPKKWVGNTCTSCPSPRQWYGSTCRCPSGQEFVSYYDGFYTRCVPPCQPPLVRWHGFFTCECPGGRRKRDYYYNGRCNPCARDYYYNGRCNPCARSYPNLDLDNNKCCPRGYRYFKSTFMQENSLPACCSQSYTYDSTVGGGSCTSPVDPKVH